MTEGTYTQNLLKKLKAALGPAYTVLKHSDRFTKGVPDLSVSNNLGKTVWVEVKHFHERSQHWTSPKSFIDSKPQHYITAKLGGLYLVRDPYEDKTALLVASKLDPEAEALSGDAVMWTHTKDSKAALQDLIQVIEDRL